MKHSRLKALAYSLFLSVLFLTLILLMSRDENSFMSVMIPTGLSFCAFLIIFWDNKPLIRYFWKGKPEWLKPADHWFMALLVALIYLSVRYVWFYYQEDASFHYLGCLMCLSAALSYRRIYLNNAPEDIELYERERQESEEMDTFITVAECKDVESAHIIKSMLESKGLEVLTYGESAPKYIGSFPVRVLVRKKDKEAAEKLIEE